jgi:hypothetical protein
MKRDPQSIKEGLWDSIKDKVTKAAAKHLTKKYTQNEPAQAAALKSTLKLEKAECAPQKRIIRIKIKRRNRDHKEK